jgi:hypothetical protein
MQDRSGKRYDQQPMRWQAAACNQVGHSVTPIPCDTTPTAQWICTTSLVRRGVQHEQIQMTRLSTAEALGNQQQVIFP